MQKVLAINAGSSSLKFCLYAMPQATVLLSGCFERIGEAQPKLRYKDQCLAVKATNHIAALNQLFQLLLTEKLVTQLTEIVAVGHRVAHGGETFYQATVVDQQVYQAIAALNELAPLHNPLNLMGIHHCQQQLPQALQVAVFDTAFHQTLAPAQYLYPVPYQYYQDYHIRKYGFHGTSHQYVGQLAAQQLGQSFEQSQLITCHLGNGASVCCIENGRSKDISMGFTPAAGLMMGTRAGDLDPTILPFLQRKLGLSCEDLNTMLTQQSGLLGVSGCSNDFRDVLAAATKGQPLAQVAVEMFVQRIVNFILAYRSELDRLDGLVFTAGIGEHSAWLRQQVCQRLGCLNIQLDPTKNNSDLLAISAATSQVPVFVIPTNEEYVLAQAAYQLFTKAEVSL